MPLIPLHPPSPSQVINANSLPPVLRTPSGLALLELQGSIHAPPTVLDGADNYTPIGKLVFPLYNPEHPVDNSQWMKRVYLFVGQHQRLTGEVKQLPKAFAVVRRRVPIPAVSDDDVEMDRNGDEMNDEIRHVNQREELEIAEIVKYKVVFSTRPEPVGQD